MAGAGIGIGGGCVILNAMPVANTAPANSKPAWYSFMGCSSKVKPFSSNEAGRTYEAKPSDAKMFL